MFRISPHVCIKEPCFGCASCDPHWIAPEVFEARTKETQRRKEWAEAYHQHRKKLITLKEHDE